MWLLLLVVGVMGILVGGLVRGQEGALSNVPGHCLHKA